MNKKNFFWFAAITAVSAMASGCGNRVYVEKDESANLAKYKTYAWVEMKDNKDDSKNVTSFADAAVKSTAREILEKKGWTLNEINPDVLLSYDVLVERGSETQSQAVYSQPYSRVYYNPYLRRWGTVYYPSQFMGYDSYDVPVREGTLTLTMTNPETDKVIWQGWTTKSMEDRKFATSEIKKAVKTILKKF
jgi:hypothetical protein